MAETQKALRPNFPVATALTDLKRQELLVTTLVAREGRLEVLESAAELPAEAAFAGAAIDSRHLPAGSLFVALPGERADGRDHIGAALEAGHWALAGSEPGPRDRRGVSLAAELAGLPAPPGTGVLVVTAGAEALTALAAAHRARWSGAMVGITGTNGKTTCKDLCAAMLAGAGPVLATGGNFNNRLGVPLTLLGLAPGHGRAVVEMGASAGGQIASLADLVRPDVGLITNAGSAHLAEFGSLEGVIQGKGELLDALPASGTAVLNADSPGFAAWLTRSRCPVVSFGASAGDHRWSWRSVPGRGWITTVDRKDWPTPLPGRHNGGNLAAALLAARAAGLEDAAIREGLRGFAGSPHRGRLLDWEGRLILDDCYNANPVSMVAAAGALIDLAGDGRGIAILGAMGELGPDSERLHRETGAKLAGLGLGALLAIGPVAEPLGRSFDAAGGEAHYCPDTEAAAYWLQTMTRPGDAVLLKASRSAALERILDHLPGAAPACPGD